MLCVPVLYYCSCSLTFTLLPCFVTDFFYASRRPRLNSHSLDFRAFIMLMTSSLTSLCFMYDQSRSVKTANAYNNLFYLLYLPMAP